MAVCPFAVWKPLPWTAGNYIDEPFKIVHHTTEGSTAEGAFATYAHSHDIPHFTVDSDKIYQHADTNVAVTALAHPHGTAETNKSRAIQFELVGFAGRPKDHASLRNVGLLCRWIEATHDVPMDWPNGFPKPPVNGQDAGHHNRNEQNWRHRGGHYGHCHVPNNVHWDPAYTEDEVAFIMSVQAAHTPVIVNEKEHLGPMTPTGGGLFTVSARSGLRLRAGPGTSFDILRLLPFGTLVHAAKSNDDWTVVDLVGDQALDGAVSSHFLTPVA